MHDLTIKKDIQKASFQLSSGDCVEGAVFLSTEGIHPSVPQNLGDLLNEKEQFIPVKTNEKILLLNTGHIVQVRTCAERESDEMMKRGSVYAISVKMLSGEVVAGDIFVSLQNGFCRVKDYLNRPMTFFRLFQTEHIVYINQRFILSIHD